MPGIKHVKAKTSEAVGYADLISVEVQDSPSNECPGYDTRASDGEALVLKLWVIHNYSQVHSDRRGNTVMGLVYE